MKFKLFVMTVLIKCLYAGCGISTDKGKTDMPQIPTSQQKVSNPLKERPHEPTPLQTTPIRRTPRTTFARLPETRRLPQSVLSNTTQYECVGPLLKSQDISLSGNLDYVEYKIGEIRVKVIDLSRQQTERMCDFLDGVLKYKKENNGVLSIPYNHIFQSDPLFSVSASDDSSQSDLPPDQPISLANIN